MYRTLTAKVSTHTELSQTKLTQQRFILTTLTLFTTTYVIHSADSVGVKQTLIII